jgi:hypothetical protein
VSVPSRCIVPPDGELDEQRGVGGTRYRGVDRIRGRGGDPGLEIPAAGRTVDAYVWCEPGERVLGGFYGGLPPGGHVVSEGPELTQTRQGWSFSLSTTTGGTVLTDFSARATCVS